MDAINDHRRHADSVRAAVTGAGGVSEKFLRDAVASRAAGGATIAEPYDTLAQQIGQAADQVNDEQVAAVRATEGSDKGAFEMIMAASIGAGLARWEAAIQAMDEANDATT